MKKLGWLERSQLWRRRTFLQASAGWLGTQWFGVQPAKALAKDAKTTPSSPGFVRLFNGKDLTGLYGWLKDTQYKDPRKVFTVEDGILKISGEVAGYLATEKEYRDYRLVVEYKWGAKTYGAKTARNSGILLHAIGPDGNPSPWMSSIECQVAQGCVGDFIVIRGKDNSGKPVPVTLTSDTVLASDGRTRWKKGGKPTAYSGKQFWWSKHEPGFEEIIDTRGKEDVDSPLGEWTRLECICSGKRITVVVNGVTVNECYNVYPSAGKILLESEGFEIHFRKFELQPLLVKEAVSPGLPKPGGVPR
jgi:3-keto-disaccharide hydrolase